MARLIEGIKRAGRRAAAAKLRPRPAIDRPAGITTAIELPRVEAPPLAMQNPPEGRFWAALWLTPSAALAAAFAAMALIVAALPGGSALLLPACLLSALAAALHLWLLIAGSGTRPLSAENARLKHRLEAAEDKTWELSESEERYRSLSEAFGDIVIHCDQDGRIIFANSGFVRTFGADPAGILGKPFNPKIIEETGSEAAGGAPFARTRETCLLTLNGPRWFRWIDTPVRDERTGLSAARSVARDITAHKLAERALETARQRAEQASEAKSRFLAMVSHEMRTPLNGILGMAALLRDTALMPDQSAYNDAIRSSGEALLALIEDMLDLTMIEAGRFELKPEEFGPARLVEDVSELLASRAHAKGIGLASTVEPNVPALVRADAGRVRQVLVNLIGNAIKFTEKGGVSVSLAASPADRDGNLLLEFTVTDTGPGLADYDQGRIFEEFVQADSATTRRHGGAGLGLSISQGLARKLGGAIRVESKPGHGSRFRFSAAAQFRRGAEFDQKALAGRNILIASAVKTEAEALAATIGHAGGRAQIATTLKRAAGWLEPPGATGFPVDAIVLDAALSRDPGKSLARLTRRRAAAKPFSVAFLRPANRSRLQAIMDAGFDAYLVSPVRQASLIKVLGEEKADHFVPQPSETSHPLLVPGEKLKPRRVLLAEDNDINALLVGKLCERAGQRVETAADGRAAVRAYRDAANRRAPFDLVLMDLHMPVMDGQAAIRAIRRHEARHGLKRARILTLSADGRADMLQGSLDAGADGTLTKPVDPQRLVAVFRQMR